MNAPGSLTTTAPMVTEPPFWTDQLDRIPWCVEFRASFPAIRDEILHFIAGFRPFMDYPKYGDLYVNTWKAFPLSKFQGEHVELSKQRLNFNVDTIVAYNRSKLPVLSGLIGGLEQDGHLRNAFVSKLIPGSIINPHRGWTSEYLRIHMGLVCDPECRITVGEITQTWKPGEMLAFKDGGPYPHSVRHTGTHERIVISTDLTLRYVSQFIPEITGAGSSATPAVPAKMPL
jgi:aspartyl/asparaginyl beta-hydroxylase (cupin superfamily)